MNLLFLCGCYESQHEPEVALQSKKLMETASNLHQHRLIQGLRSQNCTLQVVSAPFIGAWPTQSKQLVFRGFQSPSQQKITYVSFHNLWGWRSISRARVLRKMVDRFLKDTHGTKRAMLVYAPHTPFLQAAVHAKRKEADLHICLIVPDLPQYMNLNTGTRWFYDFCKFFDIRLFEKLNRHVDSYLLLTHAMAEVLHVDKRPFVVAEGLTNSENIQRPISRTHNFVYAGKLMRRFGIQRLLDAFAMLTDSRYRLIICGDGEMRAEVEAAALQDERICYAGLLPPHRLKEIFANAGVLVNPRTSEDAYTRYSFPSKVIEYLQTGLPVVSNILDGMPPVYQTMVYCVENNSVAALAAAMEKAMCASAAAEEVRIAAVQEHLQTLHPSEICKQLVTMIAGEAVHSA